MSRNRGDRSEDRRSKEAIKSDLRAQIVKTRTQSKLERAKGNISQRGIFWLAGQEVQEKLKSNFFCDRYNFRASIV